MKTNKITFFFIIILFLIVYIVFFKEKKDTYVLPNNYTGFFAVIYNDRSSYNEYHKIFEIPKSGVCSSDFPSTKGHLTQEFIYKNGKEIKTLGFDMITYVSRHNDSMELLKNNPKSLFGIYFLGVTDNSGQKICVYWIATADCILKMLPNVDTVFKSMLSGERNINSDIRNMEKYINQLNKEYANY